MGVCRFNMRADMRIGKRAAEWKRDVFAGINKPRSRAQVGPSAFCVSKHIEIKVRTPYANRWHSLPVANVAEG